MMEQRFAILRSDWSIYSDVLILFLFLFCQALQEPKIQCSSETRDHSLFATCNAMYAFLSFCHFTSKGKKKLYSRRNNKITITIAECVKRVHLCVAERVRTSSERISCSHVSELHCASLSQPIQYRATCNCPLLIALCKYSQECIVLFNIPL